MSHSHGAMNMGSMGLFRTRNQDLARAYWYIVAGVVGVLVIVRAFEHWDLSSRFTQAYATMTAVLREMRYPHWVLQRRGVRWLSPPPMGQILFLAIYWAIIVYMLCYRSISDDAYYYERMGFRGAWISVTQVPLVYLLATKSSLVGFLIGSSHDQLNWLHRWVSRTLLVTASVHGGFFFREWVKADFVAFEYEYMPMVRYGTGAWFVLLWTFLSSLSPVRRLAYEVFVLQHLAAAAVFLWLLWTHVPAYAKYNVYFAVAAASLDWVLRGVGLLWRNVRLRLVGPACKGMQRLGHTAQLEVISRDIVVITVRDVNMNWKAGQHLYLRLPWLGPLESHPFTIASPYQSPNDCSCNDIQFAIRVQKGFTRRAHRYAEKRQRLGDQPAVLKAFISGPYGHPPEWNAYETLVLISASTGASFTLPVLESVLSRAAAAAGARSTVESTLRSGSSSTCVQRIRVILIARHRHHVQWYLERLEAALVRAHSLGLDLEVHVAITGVFADDDGEGGEVGVGEKDGSMSSSAKSSRSRSLRSGGGNEEEDDDEKKERQVLVQDVALSSTSGASSSDVNVDVDVEKGCCGRTTIKSTTITNAPTTTDDISSSAAAASPLLSSPSPPTPHPASQPKPCCTTKSPSTPCRCCRRHTPHTTLPPHPPPPGASPSPLAHHQIIYTRTRPHLETHIRAALESTGGETLVAVCGGDGGGGGSSSSGSSRGVSSRSGGPPRGGGSSRGSNSRVSSGGGSSSSGGGSSGSGPNLTAHVRNVVARLSDERAVHKGSGAQGVRVWVEGYAF